MEVGMAREEDGNESVHKEIKFEGTDPAKNASSLYFSLLFHFFSIMQFNPQTEASSEILSYFTRYCNI